MQRVFIGIPVNQTAQQKINKLLYPYQRTSQGIAWVPEDNRHLTLAFLGDRHDWEIESLVRSMDKAYSMVRPFQTGPASLSRFPGPAGNIVALVIEADSRITRLFQATLDFLAEIRIDSDHKPFRPHVTLGRIRKAIRPDIKFGQVTNISLLVGKIRLYQSKLTAAGPVYHMLKETRLG